MKRTIVVMAILTLLMWTLALSQQDLQKTQAPSAGKMGRMGMMQGRGGPGAMMGMMKLTDEQKAKIQDLRLAHQKEMIPLRADLHKMKASMKLEITADKFNEGKVKSIQADMSKVMNDIAAKTILHLRAVRDLLTPEQRKHFDQHILSGGMMGGGGPMGRGMMRPGGMRRPGGRMHQGGRMGMQGMNGPAMGGAGMGECKCDKMK